MKDGQKFVCKECGYRFSKKNTQHVRCEYCGSPKVAADKQNDADKLIRESSLLRDDDE